MDGIGFENFRVFKDKVLFDFAPITILTGTNSSGKSTVIKSMKLMQDFWSQEGFGHRLNFENGTHFLGDFEMCLSRKSNNKESFKIIYKIEHILFGELLLELEFYINRENILNNGMLHSVEIKTNKDIFLYSIQLKEDSVQMGCNYKYLIENALPRLSNLKIEYEKYEELIETNITLKPEDVERYNKLTDIFLNFSFNSRKKEQFYETSFFKDYKKTSLLYNSEIIELFSTIQKSEYTSFIENLWLTILEKYPSYSENHDYNSFKTFIENRKIGRWVNIFLISDSKTFDSFFKVNQNASLKLFTKYDVRTPMSIVDMEYTENMKFYDELEFTRDKIILLDAEIADDGEPNVNLLDKDKKYTLQRIFKSISIFDLLYHNNLPSEDALNASMLYYIINDAVELENEVKGDEPMFPINIELSQIKRLLRNIVFQSIKKDTECTYFVDSIRADSQRFYSFTTRESEFHSFIIEFRKQSYTDKQQDFIKKWLKEYEIADDYKIEITSGAGSQIFLVKDNEKTNLVDLGYGVTQLLPMIMKIIYCSKIGKKIIVIEEPETNLHPKLQSKLADLFLDAYKTFGIQFIIESHSEYMIRKFQYLTAKGDAKTEDIVLHYIGNPDSNKREKGEEQISTIQIKPNGQLTKPFGKGFFDEADRLVISLLDISPN